MLSAFVFVHAEPARIAELGPAIAALDGVSEVYSVTGDEDLIAVVRVRHHDDLAQVVTRGISPLPGVTRTRTSIAFQAHSRHDLEAMFSLGEA